MHQSRYFLIEWDGPAAPYTEWLATEAAEFLIDGLDEQGASDLSLSSGPGYEAFPQPGRICFHSGVHEDCLSCLEGLIGRLQREIEELREALSRAVPSHEFSPVDDREMSSDVCRICRGFRDRHPRQLGNVPVVRD